MHPGEGDEELSGTRDNDPHAAGAGRDKPRSKQARKPRGSPAKAGDLGRALRSVYDNTLREDVPPDFLDLLGKLN